MLFGQQAKTLTEVELEARLMELSRSMEQSASLMNEVEVGLKARQAAVERLKSEAETAQQIKDLSDNQQRAVSTLVRTAMAKEGNKTFWYGALVNLVFFCGGAVLTLIVK